ncbi:Uncharacterized protein dnl_01910 [Desulfonema limicola]|uniref:WxL domain-containing protein n=1 Tax=Desulfonema limicola TaxID=45656 RepID=A0A975B3A3_9BACT|nr:hypothetical protein [Desulfonema limicola]QTA77986.1 Uncharacterized protein dnl_01910 [Desulfonema limicola]
MKKSIIAALILALVFAAAPAMADMNDDVYFQVPPMIYVWGADDLWGAAPIVNDLWVLDPDAAVTDALGYDTIPGVEGTPVITGTLTGAEYPWLPGKYGTLMEISNPALTFTDTDTDGWLSPGDTLAPISLTSFTDVGWPAAGLEHSFYVASNCVFNIKAQSSIVTKTGDFAAIADTTLLAGIDWTRAITVNDTDGGLVFGANAQDPTGGGGDLAPGVTTLNDVAGATPTTVITGGQKTASSGGAGVGIAQQSVRIDNTYTMANAYDLSQGNGTIHALVKFTVWKP